MTHPIDLIPEMRLTAADEAAIAALLARSFPTDFGGRSFFNQHHHLRLVIRDGGAIVSHIAVVLRSVDIAGQRVTVAGLAEVATDPAHRGKGHAATLLRAAIEAASASPAAYVLLFGDAPLYAAAGFQPASNKMAHVVTKGARVGRVVSDGDDHLMVLPLRGQSWPKGPLDLRGPVF